MPRGPIPADIKAAWLTAIVDSREQNPLDLAPLKSVTGTLQTGDHQRAGQYVARLLFIAGRRRWRECRGILTKVMEVDTEEAAGVETAK